MRRNKIVHNLQAVRPLIAIIERNGSFVLIIPHIF